MQIRLSNNKSIDTTKGIDISLPAVHGEGNVKAWYVDDVLIEPVMTEQFVGDINQGGGVNFNNIRLNPHGNCTHTECVGHISSKAHSINDCLKEFHFYAKLITLNPISIDKSENGISDRVITKDLIARLVINMDDNAALVIRTIPNELDKKNLNYSSTNPPYLTEGAMHYINALEVKHLLIDLPSVDRESDDGKVACHHLFWNYPDNPDLEKTITELIYVDNAIEDGEYFMNMQIMSIENDAAPSKIVLYEMFDS